MEPAEHIPPSDCSWWNTHVASVFPAPGARTPLRSKPQQCAAADPAKPTGLLQTKHQCLASVCLLCSILPCLHKQPEWMCLPLLLSSCPSSDQGEGGQPGGGRRRQRRLREPNQEDQVWHQADQGECATVFSMQLWNLKTHFETQRLFVLLLRCSKVLTRRSKPSTPHPPPHSVAWLWRQTAKSISSQVTHFILNSTLCRINFTLASNTCWLLLLSSLSRQTGGWRDGAHHALQLHHGLGVHKCHPEEEPDSALRNGLWLQGKVPSVAIGKLWFLSFSKVNLNSYDLSLIFRLHAARPSRAPSPGRQSACGWTGWSRGQLTDSRLSTLLASRGTMTLVPGTEGQRHPKGISLTSKTRNSTITKESEDVEMYRVQNRTKKKITKLFLFFTY